MDELIPVDLSGIPGATTLPMIVAALQKEVTALRHEVGKLKSMIKTPECFTAQEAAQLLEREIPDPEQRSAGGNEPRQRSRRRNRGRQYDRPTTQDLRPREAAQRRPTATRKPIRLTGDVLT